MATAYTKERRYVLRMLAHILQSAVSNGDDWIRQDETGNEVDEPTERRRVKAMRALAADFAKKGSASHG